MSTINEKIAAGELDYRPLDADEAHYNVLRVDVCPECGETNFVGWQLRLKEHFDDMADNDPENYYIEGSLGEEIAYVHTLGLRTCLKCGH